MVGVEGQGVLSQSNRRLCARQTEGRCRLEGCGGLYCIILLGLFCGWLVCCEGIVGLFGLLVRWVVVVGG